MSTLWKAIYLELPTPNIALTIVYFETFLGFTTDFHLKESGYAKVSRDAQSIFLSLRDTPFEPQNCMIYSEDIQGAYQEMKDAGVEICREIKALSVGTTEFSIRIPDGHTFTFFQ
jgi:predicted enzyme related to lactoylglutathione lyase